MQYLVVFFMSMVPLIEQRGAIPVGIFAYDLNYFLVFIISLAGSFVPAPFIYLFFNRILDLMKGVKFFDKFTKCVYNKIQKNSKKIEKYEEIGLIAFVGIPLPTTGLWTGSAAAAFLGLDFKKSMICVFAGGLISATIITMVCYFVPSFFQA